MLIKRIYIEERQKILDELGINRRAGIFVYSDNTNILKTATDKTFYSDYIQKRYENSTEGMLPVRKTVTKINCAEENEENNYVNTCSSSFNSNGKNMYICDRCAHSQKNINLRQNQNLNFAEKTNANIRSVSHNENVRREHLIINNNANQCHQQNQIRVEKKIETSNEVCQGYQQSMNQNVMNEQKMQGGETLCQGGQGQSMVKTCFVQVQEGQQNTKNLVPDSVNSMEAVCQKEEAKGVNNVQVQEKSDIGPGYQKIETVKKTIVYSGNPTGEAIKGNIVSSNYQQSEVKKIVHVRNVNTKK